MKGQVGVQGSVWDEDEAVAEVRCAIAHLGTHGRERPPAL